MTARNMTVEFVRLAEQELAGEVECQLNDEELAELLTAAVRLYASRAETRDAYPAPLLRNKVTATDVAVVASEMVRVVDLNMFDLSMWHSRARSAGR